MTQEYDKTEEHRKVVESMTRFGIPQDDIALVIGITAKTMRKHYREELDTSKAKAIDEVANILFKKCTVDQDTTSILFYLKTQGRWSETIKNETRFTDVDGKDLHAKDKKIVDAMGIK